MGGVLFITIEGMGTSLIGSYGSNIGATPTLDELSAHGIVFDQCFLDSQDLAQQLTSLATAQHSLQPQNASMLWELLKQSAVPARFYSDSSTAAQWAADAGCEQVTLIQPTLAVDPATTSDQCAVVALFASVAEEISDGQAGGLIWVHSQGLRLPWDAPLSLRSQFTDPDDPDPPSEIGPPGFEVTEDTDPDAIIGWGQVAAAQVSMIDDCLGSLLSIFSSQKAANDWVVGVVGLGGVPLGEHGRVGWGRPQLHGEELQCVAIIRPAPAAAIGWRRAEICQLPDIGATLRQACGLAEIPENQPTPPNRTWGRSLLEWIPSDNPSRWSNVHKVALLRNKQQAWLRVPAWSAVWQLGTEGDVLDLSCESESVRVQLYVKPDDRWEVSEIADRCPDIVDSLRSLAQATTTALQENNRGAWTEPDSQLCELLR